MSGEAPRQQQSGLRAQLLKKMPFLVEDGELVKMVTRRKLGRGRGGKGGERGVIC